MNILIPDKWLREHLKTDATPAELKSFLSLCGPSIERVNRIGGETVYDIEITTNRVDAFSVRGIAAEAVAILPQFNKHAALIPYEAYDFSAGNKKLPELDIKIKNDPRLCRRILAVVIDGVTVSESPKHVRTCLELAGQRPLNNAVDITNYVMWELGHPVHAFDYDRLTEKTIIVREAEAGETAVTLDGNTHTFRGGEVVFDDGTGEIIDIPGIMGTENSAITEKTKRVLLWIEDIDARKIRLASMGLSIRTQAAVINEKNPDPELGYDALRRAAHLYTTIAGGTVSTLVTDIYPGKTEPATVTLTKPHLVQYLGTDIPDGDVTGILTRLGFRSETVHGKGRGTTFQVTPPTSRAHDVVIAADVIEEVARIFGYHNVGTALPSQEPPVVVPDPVFAWENEIKTRLRDWGYTETYTYSMISERQLELFGYDLQRAYRISNLLTADCEFMRPGLVPSLAEAVRQNMPHKAGVRLFELSNAYLFRPGELPEEREYLVVMREDDAFREMKGLQEALCGLFGIHAETAGSGSLPKYADSQKSTAITGLGWVGFLDPKTAYASGISTPVTVLELDFAALVKNAKPEKTYIPIPKYPPVFEDLTFVVPEGFESGPFIDALKNADRSVSDVQFADWYADTRTFHITYLNKNRNLTAEDITPVRTKLIEMAKRTFGAVAKVSGVTTRV